MQIPEDINWIELAAACCSIVYSLLLMREKISGWFFGIASSVLSVLLFYETKLYAQSLISIYYAGVGVYGWWYWFRARKRDEHIHRWQLPQHLTAIGLFTVLSFGVAFLFKRYTDSASPYMDSFLTLFGILASIKEARKILTSWIYWLVINLFSAWLYGSQGLYIYAVLMVVYAGICIPGYLSWLKIYRSHATPAPSA